MESILVATDLSARSAQALRRAMRLATDSGAQLTVAHVIDDDLPGPVILRRRAEAEAMIEQDLRTWPQLPALRVKVAVAAGQGHNEILRMARDRGVKLIVLGIHRHTGVRDLFRGSTIGRVVGYAESAVMVARTPGDAAYRAALVAMDTSLPAQGALAYALTLVRDGPVTALHAHEDALPASVKQQLKKTIEALPGGSRARLVTREGPIRDVLRAELDLRLPDVVVLGTRGLRGVERTFRGSVALDMLGDAPCDVIAVPGG